MMGVLRPLFGLFLAAALAGCAASPKSSDTSSVTLSGGGNSVRLDVEVANSPMERERGLMDRTELRDGAGMLFVMERETVLKFWMKNTLIPLDILFFDEGGNFVSSASMVPCEKDPCPLTVSAGPASFALEVPAGSAARWNVGTGWILRRE